MSDIHIICRSVSSLERDAIAAHRNDLHPIREFLVQPVKRLLARCILDDRSGKSFAYDRPERAIGRRVGRLSVSLGSEKKDARGDDVLEQPCN
jgi:hypothetical protein